MRPIVVQKQDETQTVVKSGLEPPERVVTTGFVRLTDGGKISISDASTPAQPQGARPRDGQQRQRGGNTTRPNTQQ